MEPKVLKSTLKNAREAVKNKNYQEVYKLANEILQHDPKNYHGLVFLGISLPEVDPSAVKAAVDSYKEAAVVSPDQPLAWQGLATLYEKNPIKVYQEACVKVYERLMSIYEKAGGEIMEKYFEVGIKLAKLHLNRKNMLGSAEMFESLLSRSESENVVPRRAKVAKVASDSLGALIEQLPKEQGAFVEKIFMTLVTDDALDESEKLPYYERLIRAMIKNGRDAKDVVGMTRAMHASFPDTRFPLEILIHFELSLGLESLPDLDKLEELRDEMRAVSPDSYLIRLVDGVDSFATKNFLRARNDLKAGHDAIFPKIHVPGAVFLAKTYNAVHDHPAALAMAKTVKKYLHDSGGDSDIESAFVSKQRIITSLDLIVAHATIEGGGSEEDIVSSISALQELMADASNKSADPLSAFGFSILSEERIEEVIGMAKANGLEGNGSLLILEGVLMVRRKRFDSALELFSAAVEINPENGQHHFWRGRAIWEKVDGNAELEECFSELLLAAKLDPYYSPTFLYLGHYYARIQEDEGKALKCYQRAFELDNCNSEAGSNCVDLMVAIGQSEQAFQLVHGVTRSLAPDRAKWAWLRLAVHYLNVGENDAAVMTLQDLLKADSGDWIIWECLGEAYTNRGSYMAALKSFERALELEPQASFSKFQKARIKQLTGAFLEAKNDYLKMLDDDDPDFIPALKGLGETLIELAKIALKHFYNGKAVDLCHIAIEKLTHAASLRPDLVCVWKLLGDACTLLHIVPDHLCEVRLPAKLAHDPTETQRTWRVRKTFAFQTTWDSGEASPDWNEPADTIDEGAAKEQRVRTKRRRGAKEDEPPSDPTGEKVISKLGLLFIGNRCYRRALKLQGKEDAGLLSDLAYNYFAQSELVLDEDITAKRDLATNALDLLKEAVIIDPYNHLCWLGLGTVASCSPDPVRQLPLAQHAFIKSINVEANNPVAWTNLGALYLLHGPKDKKLAHLAFKAAQNLDPGYVGGWVGQALIAESIGDPEAMDLFRVTVTMENNSIHSEGLLGYGHWVCKMLLRRGKQNRSAEDLNDSSCLPEFHLRYIFEKMGAIHVAADALTKFCDRYPEHVPAATMLSLLQERQFLKQSAANGLNRALESLKGIGLAVKKELEIVGSNLARVLCSLNKSHESIVQYKQLPDIENNLFQLAGFGLALFKSGQLMESYVVFEKCCELAPERFAACLQACLGMVSHKYNDIEGAKTCLFKCIEIDRNFLPGLVALASTGLIHDDLDLCMAALEELLKASALPESTVVEVARLFAPLLIEHGDYKSAKNHIQKAIKKYPSSSKSWAFLSQFILRYSKDECALASVAARSAQAVDAKNDEAVLLESLGMLVGASPLEPPLSDSRRRAKQSKSAIMAAAKAVHLHPDKSESWASLTASTYMMDVLHRLSSCDTSLVKEGATLAASRSAFAIAASKSSNFLSQVSSNNRMYSFIGKQHVLNLIRSGGDSLREAKKIINVLQEGNNLETMGPILSQLEVLVNKGISNRTVESFKEAVNWDNGLFGKQLLLQIFSHTKADKEIEELLQSCVSSDHPSKLIFWSLILVRAFSDLSQASDPFTAKTPEAQKLLDLISNSHFKELESNLVHLICGIVLFKSNIKQAQKYLFKVHNANFPPPMSDVPRKIARRLLIKVLAGKKEKEKVSLASLLKVAVKDGDKEFVAIYDNIVPAI